MAFYATTTAKIAKQAGVSEGTIYKYFKSKDELLASLLQPILIEIKNNFFTKLDDYDNLPTLIHFIVTDRLQFIDVNFDFIRLLLQEILTNQLLSQNYANFYGDSNGIEARIKRLKERYPEINQSLTPIQIIRSIIGPMLVFVLQTKLFQVPAEDNDLEVIQQQIINGLTVK